MQDTRSNNLFEQAQQAHQQGKLQEAELLYSQLLAAYPNHAGAWCYLGILQCQSGRGEQGIELIRRSLQLDPGQPHIHNNLGVTLSGLNRHGEAIESFSQAIALMPGFAQAHTNRGISLKILGRTDDAVADFKTASTLNDRDPGPWFALGQLYRESGRHQEAGEALAQGCRIQGQVQSDLEKFHEAVECFSQALQLKPDMDYGLGLLMMAKMKLWNWDTLEAERETLRTGIENHKKLARPFDVMRLYDNPRLHRLAAEIYVEDRFPPVDAYPVAAGSANRQRIHVGYFSPDYRDHPVSHLMAGLFESHDREHFEISAFSFGPQVKDAMRSRLENAFDHFHDVSELSDQDIVQLSRKLGVDIAVDLAGYTKHHRTGIFARRAAPVQIGYIGYLGTMGAPYMDYLVADRIIIPENHRHHYAEKILYLPCYQVNDPHRPIADRPSTREEVGLPEKSFVFCCFNSSYKINPEIFDAWSRIMGSVEDSVLWLVKNRDPKGIGNLRREASKRGIDPERLIFASPLPPQEYRAQYRLADLFLDTLPYNAGTTASDALWAGLPVLTCTGESFPARMAASLLHAIGVPEMVTDSLERYEARAIHLAHHPGELQEIRRRLARNRTTHRLFDMAGFTRHLESAYSVAIQRSRRGLPPEHIEIMG